MVVLSVLAFPAAAYAPDLGPRAKAAYWQTRGCDHGYKVRAARRGVRAVMRSPRRLTRERGRRAWRFARCVETVGQARRLARAVRRWRSWRRSYRGWWRIQAERRPGAHARLARLRWCESTGNYWIWNPPYSGAYQYLASTWGRAQWWVPARYRTGAAASGSVDHQDVVTDRFYWSHSGEWACSA